jgi:hypothetical protein
VPGFLKPRLPVLLRTVAATRLARRFPPFALRDFSIVIAETGALLSKKRFLDSVDLINTVSGRFTAQTWLYWGFQDEARGVMESENPSERDSGFGASAFAWRKSRGGAC